MKINVLLVISKISKVVFFEWMAAAMDKDKFNVSFAILNDSPTEIQAILSAQGFQIYHIPYRNKLNLPKAIWTLTKILKHNEIDVIHTHLLDATLAGMVASRIRNTKKRIFTRHHSNYHHIYNRKGIFYDKLCNSLATDIVAITDIVRDYLIQEGSDPNKITLIHHGFRLEDYSECTEERVNAFRLKNNIPKNTIIIGVVSRYTLWKGIQFIIPAFSEFVKKHPQAILLLANAKGNDEKLIKNMLSKLPQNNVREIVYERDMAALYHSLTLFVHTPIDRESEAFGQTYIEAMAAGIPSVITMSGIVNDFVTDNEHALVVPFQNSESVLEAMEQIISSSVTMEKLKLNGKKIVEEKFSLNRMVKELQYLYSIK